MKLPHTGEADRYRALAMEVGLGGQGPSVAIKDCIDIAGFPTRAGSAALAEAEPASEHADVVRQLLAAGWRVVAKANMHELAYGMTGINDWAGTPVNPRDPLCIPGGSSSGSAVAVGAGLVDVAIGSDTGGSIRVPAACCGVIGMKPTFGRVSRKGAWPRASTLDCIGPFARDMALLNAAMSVIAADFDLARASRPQDAARVRVLDVEAEPVVQMAMRSALDTSGWRTIEGTLPLMQAGFDAGLTLINAETYTAFAHLAGDDRLGADVAQRLALASTTTAAAREEAERVRIALTAEVDRQLEDVDALVLPTLPHLPPTLQAVREGFSVVGMSTFVRPFNLSGHPALSLPLPAEPGRPAASIQLVGHKGDDERVCALALHLQRALDSRRTDFRSN
ncbi:Amidase [Paraburkholderia unamae]|uniref:amidase n=1 Tax=Paraburkholderia unamae TaxID=219649 RepID=UPI001CB3028B|nr:amidase [Paraburkholderia unamae]CAG9251597.1 Amidase [Paraburkholderia unamae]